MSPKPQRLFSKMTGAIFAGGESRRMGQPKEGLRLWDNRPMLAHVIDALAPLCDELVIVGQCLGYDTTQDSRLTQIPDRHPGLGPLSALDALLSSGLATQYLVASCDQPLLNPSVLQLLVAQGKAHPEQAVFFQTEEGLPLDPFPGIYPAALFPKVQATLAAEQYAIRKMLHAMPIQWVILPEAQRIGLSNCNTPASVAELTQLFSTQEPAL